MRKSHYTEEQIAFALRQAELGSKVVEVFRKMGVSGQTFCRWKKKYSGGRRGDFSPPPAPPTTKWRAGPLWAWTSGGSSASWRSCIPGPPSCWSKPAAPVS